MAGMSDTPETRQVSIDEAAQILGLSRRTIERRLTDGRLSGHRQGVRWLVDVPVSHDAPTPFPDRRDDAKTRKLSEVTRERDELARRVADLEGERDYLRQALAAALTLSQQLLPERAEAPSSPTTSTTGETTRPRWQFWRRD
jgi:excisionase family DNA binding protein